MASYCDFVEQESVDTEQGRLRPDLVVRLPEPARADPATIAAQRDEWIDAWTKAGKDVSAYNRDALMSVEYDDSELAAESARATTVFGRSVRRSIACVSRPLSMALEIAPTFPRAQDLLLSVVEDHP